jgi:hypothetical protein
MDDSAIPTPVTRGTTVPRARSVLARSADAIR